MKQKQSFVKQGRAIIVKHPCRIHASDNKQQATTDNRIELHTRTSHTECISSIGDRSFLPDSVIV